MEPTRLRLAIVGVIGFLAPLWWTWAVSQATYAVFVAIGSPKRPTTALLWGSVYAPSLLIGFVAGVIVAVLSATAPLKGWLVFVGAHLASSLVLGLYFGEPVEYLGSLFGSVGTWLFLAGSMLWPGVAHVRKRAV